MTRICFLAPHVNKSNLSRPMAFAKLLSNVHETKVAGPGEVGMPFYKEEPGVELHRLSNFLPFKILEGWKMARNSDVVVACDIRFYSCLVGALAKMNGKRFVFDTGDDEVELARFEGSPLRALIPLISSQFRFLADKVTVASSYLHQKYGGIVLPVPVSTDFFQAGDGETIRKNNCPGRSPVIAYVGTVKTSKGIFVLLDAMRQVLEEYPNAFLMVVGGAEEAVRRNLQNAIDGLKGSMLFTGHVNNLEIPDYMAAADVLVLPNLDTPVHRAQCPIKLMEYMASGTPVVATDVGCISDLLGGDSGLLVEPGDARALAEGIIRISRDDGLSSSLAENSIKIVREKYSSENSREKIESIVTGELKGSSSPGELSVSVVVPAQDEEKYIGPCVQSLKDQSIDLDELIVVDSGSRDRTASIAKSLGARVLSINRRPPGATRNAGWRSSESDIILFGDGDTVFSSDWAEKIVSRINEFTPIADARRIYKPETFYLKCLNAQYQINYHKYRPFCAWGFPRNILEETGGFEEKLTVAEERELGDRVFQAGYDIAFLPDAVQYHAGEPRTTISYWKRNFFHSKERVRYNRFTGKAPLRAFAIWSLIGISLIVGPFRPIFLVSLMPALYLSLLAYHGLANRGLFVTKLRYLVFLPFISLLENSAYLLGTTWGIWKYMIKKEDVK